MNAGGGKMEENISGAISGALDPDSKEALIHAEQYYESVRKMKNDVKSIAQNTGNTNEYISKIKNHLFMKKHDLGGENLEYFHPDFEIGQSWQRLMMGKDIQFHDHILLKHEYLEQEYILEGYSQQQAHDMANDKYNYTKALNERR